MWTEFVGVAGLEVELARRLGHLLQHEVGVEEDRVVLDPLPGLAEQLERAVVHELDADLGHQPAPAPVSRVAIASSDSTS